MCCFLTVTAADPPTDLNVEQDGPTSIRVSWTVPTSVATVTGYQIYYLAEGDSGSVPVDAGVTSYTLGNLQDGLTYNITMVALSVHLPSSVVGPETVTLGKSLYLHIPCTYFDSYKYVWYLLDGSCDTIPSSNLIARPFQFCQHQFSAPRYFLTCIAHATNDYFLQPLTSPKLTVFC